MRWKLDSTWRTAALNDEELSRVVWMHLAEPRDEKAVNLIDIHGYPAALEQVVTQPQEYPNFYRRWEALELPEQLRRIDLVKARLVLPGDEEWPSRLDDLSETPHAVLVAGHKSLAELADASVSLVGARAATHYGQRIAAQMACELGAQGLAVVSGGAFGVDAAAHRGALLESAGTVCVVAGGIERAYPAAHASMFDVIRGSGVIVSEMPIGAEPMRQRFLHRNRLIAALSLGTVVIEAGLRSGSLSTARRAEELCRVVGAVPGPVTSAASAGCHELIRDGAAVLVTGAEDVVELIGGYQPQLTSAETRFGRREAPEDQLSTLGRIVWDALPRHAPNDIDVIAEACGRTVREVVSAMGELQLCNMARREGSGWLKA